MTNGYIENTLASIAAAFEMGATIVEIDIRRSRDNHLVVYHDGRLECRTNGVGAVSDQPLEYLRSLDIGHGYTHDGGETYPFRGKGIGAMPTLIEVLQTFAEQQFWIDHKDGAMETAELLGDVLETLPEAQQQRLYYWGGDETYAYIHGRIPAVTRLVGIRPQVKRCFLPYLLTFGVAGFPEECRGVGIGMPAKYAPLIWGWPYRFLRQAAESDVRFYLLIDSEEEALHNGAAPVDGVITDYIEVIGQHLGE